MSEPKYRLNPAAFRKNLLQADFMVAEMGLRAQRVAETAEATAHEDTGNYKRRFRVKALRRGGIHEDRAEGRVVNTDPGALSIEFGHVTDGDTYVAGQYTMTSALDAAGD
jgi:hypothetical protein